MSVTLPITTFVRDYSAVLEQHPDEDVVLERRAGREAVVVRSLRRTEGDRAAVQTISNVLAHLLDDDEFAAAVADGVQEQYPWMALLPADDRSQCSDELVSMLRACAALGRFGAMHDLVESWKATAEVYADPDLARRLQQAVPDPDGASVPEPARA